MRLNESRTSLFLIPILIRGLKATKIMRGGKPQADSMEGIFTSRGLGFWGILLDKRIINVPTPLLESCLLVWE